MGGCRCVYRNCESSTSTSPGLHYFHFPVKDVERCKVWVNNAKKAVLRTMPRDKLRNKVVCSLHFEDRYFSNEKHDRLVHNAIPTLGDEDGDFTEDPLYIPYRTEITKDSVRLIALDDKNTNFKKPEDEFKGASYTIFNDNVIPIGQEPAAAAATAAAPASTTTPSTVKHIQVKKIIKPAVKVTATKKATIQLDLGPNDPDVQFTSTTSTARIKTHNIIDEYPTKLTSNKNLEKQYVALIENNSRQIKQLKRLVQKQHKMNRLILQRKQMPHYKRKLSKTQLLDQLKEHLKPSLTAILKLELLPADEVMLTDSEEKFITELYTENKECYEMLRNKFQLNLPSSDSIEETDQ